MSRLFVILAVYYAGVACGFFLGRRSVHESKPKPDGPVCERCGEVIEPHEKHHPQWGKCVVTGVWMD